MIETLRKLLSMLTPRERKQGALVLVLAFVMALFETAGVAAVFPFFLVLSDPEVVATNPYLGWAYDRGGFETHQAFLLALALVTFGVLITSALIRSLGDYTMTRFMQMRRHSLSSRLFAGYLAQPYVFFLNRHSGDMAKNILAEVEQVTMFALSPILRFTISTTMLLAVLSFLVIMDPIIALVAAMVLGTAYATIFLTIRKLISRNSARRTAADTTRYTLTREALSGIKDIRILGKEQSYLDQFHPPSIEVAKMQAANLVLGQLPKYLVEAIGFGGMLILCVVLLASTGPAANAATILPKLGIYAFAGYRMLPSVQGIYRALVELRFGAKAVEVLHDEMTQLVPASSPAPLHADNRDRISINKTITLETLGFAHDGARQGLDGISLTIPTGSSVGIVGGTGAGKTTLIDLFLGLLTPQKGQICVDDTPLTPERIRAWQATIGYVPQSIFLSDTSIAENIALGLPAGQIDMARVEQVARMAQLDQFIESDLPDAYHTMVGESGVRLSGGQRQRIGIARALYHDPDILVFDEATSALDTKTEREVMRAIAGLHGQKTILMVAHRISTVAACDNIILLEQGAIAAQGSYAELIAKHQAFRDLAGVAS